MPTDVRSRERSIEAAQTLGPALAKLAEVSRDDPAVFCQFVLRDESTGLPIQLAPIHEEWHDHLTAHDRVVIFSATELGKTSQVSVGRVLWEIGTNPNIRVLVLSSSSSGAKKIIKACKTYIENSVEFRMVFPGVVPDKSDTSGMWRDDAFIIRRRAMPKDPTVQAMGYGGAALGGRYDLIVIDDYLDAENTHTDAQRKKYHSWLKSTIEGRKTADARLWFIGNAWHPDDAMHRYAAEPQTFSAKYPVLVDGKSVWPAVWPLSRIQTEIENRGPIESRRSLFCDPVPDEERRFKLAYIMSAIVNGDGIELAYSLVVVPSGYRTVTGVDLAATKKTTGDETAITTIAVEEKRQIRQLLDIEAGRWGGPEIVQRIVDVQQRYNSQVLVESNACFVPGSLVLIRDRGYVPIEDVKIGDLAWTHRARWRRVTRVIKGSGRRISPIRASGSSIVRATPNHWFLLRRAGRTPGRGGGHYVPVGDAQWISGGLAEHAAYAAIAAPRWEPCEAVLRLPATGRAGPGGKRGGMRSSEATDIRVDRDIAMLLGLWMAEGSTGPQQVRLTLGSGEMYIAEWAKVVFQRIVPARKVTIVRRGSTIMVTVNSLALARLLKLGTGPDKCLPLEWLGWPLELRMAAVRGWLVGDGYHGINNRKLPSASSVLTAQTVSRNWAMWVRATMFEAGMRPALSAVKARPGEIDGRAIRSRASWKVSVSSVDTIALLASRTAVERKRWGDLVNGRRQRPHSTMHLGEDGHVWAYLARGPGEFEEYEGDVWNLKVDEDHSFTVNDYIVHNAQRYIKQFVNYQSAAPVKAFYTGKNKYDPSFGIESLAIEFSQGKWVLPNRGGEKRGLLGSFHPQVKKLIDEMLRYDPASHTGDRLMSLWLAREGARLGSAPAGVTKRRRRT